MSGAGRRMRCVLVAVAAGEDGAGRLRDLDDDGHAGRPDRRGRRPRRRGGDAGAGRRAALGVGVDGRASTRGCCGWASGSDAATTWSSPRRCCSGYDGRWGEPRGLAALWARLHGPAGPGRPGAGRRAAGPGRRRSSTTCPRRGLGPLVDPVDAVVPGTPTRSRGSPRPSSRRGSGCWWRRSRPAPWSPPRWATTGCRGGPTPTTTLLRRTARRAVRRWAALPRRLVELTEQIAQAFGGARLQPESPAEVLRAFSRAGHRAAVDPGVGAARRRPSGRTAAPGVQGALPSLDRARLVLAGPVGARRTVPARVRAGRRGVGAVGHPGRRSAADPEGGPARGGGRRRVDVRGGRRRPARAAGARRGRRRRAAGRGRPAPATSTRRWPPTRSAATGPRRRSPCSGAMYGQTGGAAVPALAALQARFPVAWEYVETRRPDRRGRRAGPVLARPHLPAAPSGADVGGAGPGARPVHPQLRHPGDGRRVGADAAGRRCAAGCPARAARLVFFQHDEVVVHAPEPTADEVAEAVRAAGEQAGAAALRRLARCGSRSTCPRGAAATPTRPEPTGQSARRWRRKYSAMALVWVGKQSGVGSVSTNHSIDSSVGADGGRPRPGAGEARRRRAASTR